MPPTWPFAALAFHSHLSLVLVVCLLLRLRQLFTGIVVL